MSKTLSQTLGIILLLSISSLAAAVEMANGIKIGEVTENSAIIWTRLTAHAEMNRPGIPFKEKRKAKPQTIKDLSVMEGAVPGAVGEVQVRYAPIRIKSRVFVSDWQKVDQETDFIHQFQLTNLLPEVEYQLTIVGRNLGEEEPTCKVVTTFQTAPLKDRTRTVKFTVVTGQDYPRRDDKQNGHKIYPVMQKWKPNFFVHTGDIEYYDKPKPLATNQKLARFKWNRLYALPYQREFHNRVPSYFMKDDHDTLKNDSWPGQTYFDLTWEQGLKLFKEQVPMGEKTYRTIRWGKDLQIWLVEGRDYRSPNRMPDGPEKTIWGEEQKQWFFKTVTDSDATFKILLSPTPLVGPDRGSKNDNHANKGFTHEGNQLREFIGKQKNMFVVCGDRHWQYVSVDPKTGVREYSCGPTTDVHAGGFSEQNKSDMHQYLKVKGGFLAVEITREDEQVKAIFRHFGTQGQLYHEDIQPAR